MHIKGAKQLYHKLFGIYSALIFGVVLVLMIFFIESTRSRVLETNLNYMRMMQEKSVSYLNECSDMVDNINNELYQSDDIQQDLLYRLRHPEDEYQAYRLDRYMKIPSLDYYGYDDFAEKFIKSYPNVLHIGFFSYQREELTSFYPEGKIVISRRNSEYVEKMKQANLAKTGEISFVKEIRDLASLENVGCMIVTFSAEQFLEFQKYYEVPDIMVVNGGNTVIADSLGNYTAKELAREEKQGTVESYTSSYVGIGIVKDYTVYIFLNKKTAEQMPVSLVWMILGIGTGVILAGELLLYWYLSKLTRRLNYILDGMAKVTVGELQIRLKWDEKGDELDLISQNFNEMCIRLERYIQQSYLAEIEQKNAEIEVLQNQINPHFLYNTLEAIRMKAICNKDREVAKMLYSMAVIFRSQIKDADIITLVQELHYCKKYLELFEYRYQGKFVSKVECPEKYISYPVIKFIVQPILENYFVHGIKGEKAGNEISVCVEEIPDGILIHVEDNGYGMEAEALNQMNQTMEGNRETSKKSIGLINVNRRLKAVYGQAYGVELRHSSKGGLHVILRVGMGESNGSKKSNAD